MKVDQQKTQLRATARAARRDIADRQAEIAADAVCGQCAELIIKADDITEGAVVAGFWPIDNEIDIRSLMVRLHEHGYICALPVVAEKQSPLLFRQWVPEMKLETVAFGLSQPGAQAKILTPEVLIVPLLAFDGAGYRLGWGGGYYDCTLTQLRNQGDVQAIGVGYAAQQVDKLPRDVHDQPLDWMVTEQGAIRFE